MNAAATHQITCPGRREGRVHCQPSFIPPTATLRPSFDRRIVQNSDLEIGEGERHERIICRAFGDVVIASNVCKG